VLSGRHTSAPDDAEPAPRAEFTAFVDRFDATLLSLSSLDEPLPAVARALKRAGRARLALASLVQSRAGEFDAIIASGEDIGIPIALASMAGFARTPVHMMFHGHHLESPKLRLLAPLLRRLPNVHFHCLSDSLRIRTQAVMGIPDSRCHATGYGVDTNYFEQEPVGQQVIIASAGAANRDYMTLAAAVDGMRVSVRIAADSTWVPPNSSVKTMTWPPNTEARSYGSYARLRDLYAASRFVVVPLYPARHACGYAVIAEAMAMGRAVIVTRTEAPPDFLIPGVTGLFVEPNDSASLRKIISRLLDDSGEAMAMGARARALMATINSLEAFCDRLEKTVAVSITKSYREPVHFNQNSRSTG
jgi:glycosyltransferase involved in cell wall biosynthesis